MRQTLAKAFRENGLAPSRFHYEEFEIRTGIGLRRLAAWTLRRLADQVTRRLAGAAQG